MGLALFVVCIVLLLGALVALLRGNTAVAGASILAAAAMVAAYLMDVALRAQ